jgi:(p)ppGpp synthase/HD superfamily hydrolase
MKSRWSQDLYIKAFMFAVEVHKDQKVPGSDLPYIVHLALVSMEVMAALSVEDGLDGDLAVQCALLHDVVEDTDTTIEDVYKKFGPEIARGVRALTKDKSLSENEQLIDSIKRIKLQGPEVWAVKMADRITNLQPPPSDWTDEKIAYYKKEASVIYRELKDASPFLAERLKTKIEGYNEKKDPESKRTFSA